MQYQLHFERKFYIDKKTGYWISTDYPRIRAHVWVWINEMGTIPKGFHIHHIDGNKSNNCIKNLICLSPRKHLSMHMTGERRQSAREWAALIRPLTKAWHASAEGRQWHSTHAKITFKRRKSVKNHCESCGDLYNVDLIDFQKTRFCSNACKSAYRRKLKLDDIDRGCLNCKKNFKVNKYAKRKFCSRRCSNYWKKDKEHSKTR